MSENINIDLIKNNSQQNKQYLAFKLKASLNTDQLQEISSIKSERNERKKIIPIDIVSPQRSKSMNSNISSNGKFFNFHSQEKTMNFQASTPKSNKSSTSQRITNDINALLSENFPSDQQDSCLKKFSIFVNKNYSSTQQNQLKSSFYKSSEKQNQDSSEQKNQENKEQNQKSNGKSKTFSQLNKTANYNNEFLKYVMKKTLFSQQQEAQIEKDQFEKQEQYFQLDFIQPERETQISSENQSLRQHSSSTLEYQNYYQKKQNLYDQNYKQNYYQQQQQYYQKQQQQLSVPTQQYKFPIQQQYASAHSIGGPPSLLNLSEYEEAQDSQYSLAPQNKQMSSSQFNQILSTQIQQNQTPPYMNAVQLAQDQQGCRLLQKYLDKNDTIIVNILFDQLISIIPQLIINQYGNYLCQKLAETSSHQQFLQILQVIKPTIISISLHPQGTRAIQKIIEIFSNQYSPYKQQIVSMKAGTKIQVVQVIENVNYLPQQEMSYYWLMLKELAEGLGQDIYSLASDLNGNHVLQKCFVLLSFVEKQFIFDGVMMDCAKIAIHKYGCCILQRCIDYGNLAQKEKLILIIILNLPQLILDQFANFVVFKQFYFTIYFFRLDTFQIYKDSKNINNKSQIFSLVTLFLFPCKNFHQILLKKFLFLFIYFKFSALLQISQILEIMLLIAFQKVNALANY